MRPEKIMLMRHAEKPTLDGSDLGVAEFGQSDARALSVKGWQRAGALIGLFAPPEGGRHRPGLARPDAIYAAAAAGRNDSLRPQHTVLPLARCLGLEIRSQFGKDEVDGLADELTAQDCRTVLVCWEHKVIPKLASRLLDAAARAPAAWPAERFDMVWVFDRHGDGGCDFQQVPQRLLFRDSDMAI